MPSRTELANAIRALSMDAVQQANSGHPGMPMGMAEMAEMLWNDYLHHNPANPDWWNRDRFVVSNGHGSMLLYALLHLTGYDLPMEEIKNFRQLHSKTPGHPEYGLTPGIETTTGPLGQGFGNAVGMALAEKVLAAHFNRGALNIVDHYTYVFMGDGCIMEGISHEAASLAGTHGLGKLIAFYDENGISIDGDIRPWFTDHTPRRFAGYGWHVVAEVDGHDPEALREAIEQARSMTTKPTLICCKTVIGKGAPNKQGTGDVHGAPLGEEEVAATRQAIGWHHPPFEVPQSIYAGWDARERGAALEQAWEAKLDEYRQKHPQLAAELDRRKGNELPEGFDARAQQFIEQTQAQGEKIATRKASHNARNAFAPELPGLLGGSADLGGSNLTFWDGFKPIGSHGVDGNYIYYGVREFGMAAIVNGIALYGGFIGYGATFLMFMEYMRNAVRMAALMRIHSIFIFTHDSIGLGEDGPTHQPVEQLTNLRTTPDLVTWRPGDAVETAVAWKVALQRKQGPTALVFSRQSVPHQDRDGSQLRDIERGGYILRDCDGEPQLILIATGSELDLAVQAASQLDAAVRVVSMPSAEIFDEQDETYREHVLPAQVRKRIAVEAAHGDYWRKYVGLDGDVIGINRFGESAPGPVLMQEFGFSVENVVARARALLAA